jgi:CBS domain-containing protein
MELFPRGAQMRVSFLANRPAVTCDPADTVRAVATLMSDRGVGSVVVTRAGSVVGIVTDRDIVVRGVACGLSSDVPVDRVMTRNVATVQVGADVSDAAATMCRRQVRRLPVVDAHGRLHGVITLDEVARHVAREVDELSNLLVSQSQPST